MSVTPPNLPTNTPKWISWAVKFALVAVPVFLAWVKPGNSFNSANVQAAIVIAGVALASGVHVIEILIDNLKQYGLSKAALTSDVTESVTWVKANIGDLKTVYESINGLIGHVVANNSLVQSVTTEIKAIEAKIADIPTVDRDIIIALIDAEIKRLFPPVPPVTPTTNAPSTTK